MLHEREICQACIPKYNSICAKKIRLLIVLDDKSWYYRLNSHQNVCKNKDFGRIEMLSRKDSILKFNQYVKSNKAQCII